MKCQYVKSREPPNAIVSATRDCQAGLLDCGVWRPSFPTLPSLPPITHTRAHGPKNILRRFDSLCAWLAYRPSALRRGLLRAARAGRQRRQVRRSTRDCGAALSLVEPGCVCSATETRLKVGSNDLGFPPAPCTMRGCNGSPKKIMVALDNMLPVSSQMGN